MASEGARSVLHSERRSGWHCLMVRLVRKSRDAAVDVLHDRLRVKHPWCVCGSAHALDRARVRAHDGAPGHFRKIHLADSRFLCTACSRPAAGSDVCGQHRGDVS